MKPSWRHSIQGRLVALFLVLALGTAAVFLLGMQQLLHGGWQNYARPLVTDYVDRLAAQIGSPPDVQRAQALTQELPITVRIEGPQVQFDSHPGRHSHRHDPQRDFGAAGWGLVRSTTDGHRLSFGLAAAPDASRPRLFGWITLGVLLLLTGAAYLAVRRILKPLQPISAGVAAYGAGDFSRVIRVERPDELGALAERINGMATNLSGMLDAKRTLLLAISHELRSPLTRARVNAELLDDSPERQALMRDLAEMGDLISSLLESERLAAGHRALHAEATDLPALARDTVDALAPPMAVTLQLAAVPPQQADPTRLRLLLRNLLENTRRHAAGAGQAPELFLRHDPDGQLALGVRDYGPGVPEAQLAPLAQAFYRPDSARTRESGGVGLGLYLCRLVAQAHGGELQLRNANPGLEVAMRWRPPAA